MSLFVEELVGAWLEGQIQEIVDGMFNVLVAIYIPVLIMACVKTFYGYRLSKILFIIDGVLGGGVVGMLLFGLMFQSTIGSVIGMLAGAAGGGILFWKFYMAGAGWMGFRFGLALGAIFTGALQGPAITAVLIGIAGGIGFVFVVMKYKKNAIIIAMSVMGASGISVFISLLGHFESTVNIVAGLVFLALAVLGAYMQFTLEKKNKTIAGALGEIGGGTQNMVSQAAVAKLIGVEGQMKGCDFMIGGNIVIGRDENKCNIIFPKSSNGVSRVHCTVSKAGGKLSICDNQSSYGTLVNGKKIEAGKMIALQSGDLITVGENNVFRVQA